MSRFVRKRGFTLIELLVVIAIISIIAAILFPVFAQAREKARQATCVSNEKQLSLGVLMYTQDSDEFLPPVATPKNTLLWPDLLKPYVKSDRVRVCPSDSEDAVNSYGLNEVAFADLNDNSNATPYSLAAFSTPADTIMIGELGTGDDLKTPRLNAYKLIEPSPIGIINDPGDARPAARHFDHCDLSFMDGHVKPLRLEQFYVSQTPLDKWFRPS